MKYKAILTIITLLLVAHPIFADGYVGPFYGNDSSIKCSNCPNQTVDKGGAGGVELGLRTSGDLYFGAGIFAAPLSDGDYDFGGIGVHAGTKLGGFNFTAGVGVFQAAVSYTAHNVGVGDPFDNQLHDTGQGKYISVGLEHNSGIYIQYLWGETDHTFIDDYVFTGVNPFTGQDMYDATTVDAKVDSEKIIVGYRYTF